MKATFSVLQFSNEMVV